jgi:predicted pyridoxine 5'-phosphate oxidase superfamily flavin-nucleotide-binding protein
MRHRLPTSVVIGFLAVTVVTAIAATIGVRASRATIDAGFWWADAQFLLSAGDAAKIGGPLSADELGSIQAISRDEVRRAYTDLRINITDRRSAFWRVAVVGTPLTATRNRTTYPFSFAGESRVFGPLGGSGSVAFAILAHNAIEYAPARSSRRVIVDGIGRGIGRAAVHELAHQALGLDNVAYLDNRTDTDSYEHANADRPSQYYGELRWTTAWPVLQQKFGRE